MTEEAAAQTDTETSPEAQADSTTEVATEETSEQLQAGDTEVTEESTDQAEGSTDEGESEIPETYEFEMPEGVEADQALIEAATPIFKELNLTQEQANKLTQVLAQRELDRANDAQQAYGEQLENWNQELMKDQDFGGDNFEKNSAQVRDFLHKTMPDGIKDNLVSMLETTGVGSHPDLVKYIHHLSKLMPVGEDVPGDATLTPQKETTREQRLYPDM